MKSKELFIWEIAEEILQTHGDIVDNISIHHDWNTLYDEDFEMKIYNSDGYCFELRKEYICEPSEVKGFEGVESDGYSYSFCEPWDGFKEAGIDKAIEILNVYAGLKNE